MEKLDVIIIGAGAAGLMCAIEAGKRGRNVLVLDHANKAGKKILMSGGGRCNFTNYTTTPNNYISHNPHFCKSALSQYTAEDFIALVQKYKIAYHEKAHGQLFCDHKAHDILQMLLTECQENNVSIRLNTQIEKISNPHPDYFIVQTNVGIFNCQSLVIATGGLSIPTMGASPFGYKIAEQFGLNVWPVRAGLVPFTLQPQDKIKFAELSGIGLDSIVNNTKIAFRENILFTHRGLSGPAILQISSYWETGEAININLLPEIDLFHELKQAQRARPNVLLKNFLSELLPRRVVAIILENWDLDKTLQMIAHEQFLTIAKALHHFMIKPNGTEGYRTAEVTLGGVDCAAISSKTMMVKDVSGLYFIGEVVDVTGWLGGYNFQWAWSSGWVAGQVV